MKIENAIRKLNKDVRETKKAVQSLERKLKR